MVGFGFSVGAQILMARRNGEGHFEEVGGIFYQGLYTTIYHPRKHWYICTYTFK